MTAKNDARFILKPRNVIRPLVVPSPSQKRRRQRPATDLVAEVAADLDAELDIAEVAAEWSQDGGEWDELIAMSDDAAESLMMSLGMDFGKPQDDVITACLLSLFNTETGRCAWIPAAYEGVKVVVVSVALLRWFFEANKEKYTVSGEDLSKYLQTCTEQDINWGSDAARDLLLQTPFKAVAENLRCSQFFVTPVSDWIKRLQNPGKEVDVSLDVVVPKEFGHVLSVQKTCAKVPAIGVYKISAERKRVMPAMGVKWWGELFSESVREFFGISGEVHVVDSKVKTGIQHEKYEVIRGRVRKAMKDAKK